MLSQLRHTQYQRLLRRHSGSDLVWLKCGPVFGALFHDLEDGGNGFLAPTTCDTVRFLQPLPCSQIRQGNWLGQAPPNCNDAETSLLWTRSSRLSQKATMLADASTKALVRPSLATMNARRFVFGTSDSSTGVKTTLPMPSVSVPTLKMAIGSPLIPR